jgi:hypothetical protein
LNNDGQATPPGPAVKVIQGPVNVRDKPGLDGAILTLTPVPVGDELTVTGPCEAQYLNPDGYCYHDGYYWLKAKTADGTAGYAAEGGRRDGFLEVFLGTVLPVGQPDSIVMAVNATYGDLYADPDYEGVLKELPPEVLLAIAVVESGGAGLNNEVSSIDSPIGGIMQIHPTKSGGHNQNCMNGECQCASHEAMWVGSERRSVCTEYVGLVQDTVNDLTRNAVAEVVLGRTYVNTHYGNSPDGITANIQDSVSVLEDKCNSGVCGPMTDIGDRLRCTVWAYNGGRVCDRLEGNPSYLAAVQTRTGNVALQGWFGDSYEENVYSGLSTSDKDRLQLNLTYFRHRPFLEGHICSAAELAVYDTEGRVTGVVHGETRNEIPDSAYQEDAFMLFVPVEPYHYDLVGQEAGTYSLGIASADEGQVTDFVAVSIPTVPEALHQYTIDWDALSLGEDGVTVQVDADGDGTFERTVTSDDELTQAEFMGTGPVGGIAELPDLPGASPQDAAAPGEGSGWSAGDYAALAGGLAAAAVAITSGAAWYARRRWLR